ncbi:MAG: HD domain-containing phosphohydrolase [Planctomycetota bacterium]
MSQLTTVEIPESPLPIAEATETRKASSRHIQAVDQNELKQAKIMIIDDESLVIRVVRRFLAAEGYENFVTITDARDAFGAIDREDPDVVLLDIMMPHITGLELLKIRERKNVFQHIPFIILSANSEAQIKREALELGATDFLSKPVDSSDLTLRVKNSLIVKRHMDHLANYAEELKEEVRARTIQLEKSREQIIHCLARAAEYRDNETGEHVIRVGKYCRVIADQLGFGTEYCDEIELAAQLHDVGKIGIPDSILLNPGKLSREEFEVMKQHCGLGMQIMEPLTESESDRIHRHTGMGGFIMECFDSPMLELAANIARTHHEKWDGTGYPKGLAGEDIPIEGRICCVADVYDALSSDRPYKPRFPIKRCLEIMLSERGTRFDPTVLDAFFKRIKEVHEIRTKWDDAETFREISKQKS